VVHCYSLLFVVRSRFPVDLNWLLVISCGSCGRLALAATVVVVEMMVDVMMVEEVVVARSPFSILCSKLGIFDLYVPA